MPFSAETIKEKAAEIGFHRTGIVPAQPLYEEGDRLNEWLKRGYHGQMAVYVKPRGRVGAGYMAFIKPFRHGVVYPALMRQIEHAWNKRASE